VRRVISIVVIALMFSSLNLYCTNKPEKDKKRIDQSAATQTKKPKQSALKELKQETTADRKKTGGILTFNLPSEPITLNPLLVTDIHSYFVTYLLFESLIDVDQKLNYIPRLAESWKISPDAKKITFHLRNDVTWHDGKKFSAEDVVFTFKMVTDASVSSFRFKGMFSEVSQVRALDNMTVEVYYKQPLASALQSWASFSILPKHIYSLGDFNTSTYNDQPVGSGPFRFKTWRKGKSIELTSNPNYWFGRPHLDGIIFRAIPSVNIAFKSLLRGDLDGLEVTPSLWAKYVQGGGSQKNYNAYKFPTLNFYVIAWNANGSNPFFTDKNVRRAMTLATDRRSIIQKLLLGLADTCTGPFSPHSWGYNKSIEPLPFSLKEASRLLDEAGWVDSDRDGIRDRDGHAFRFSVNIPNNNRQAEQVASMMQYNCEMIGIIMDIVRLEGATYLDRLIKKEYVSCLTALALSIDPDIYQFLHSSQIKSGFNLTSYNNPKVDSLLEEARKNSDRETRAKLYHQVHKLVHDDQPFSFLFSKPQLYVFHKRVRNILTSPQPLYLYFPGILEWDLAGEN